MLNIERIANIVGALAMVTLASAAVILVFATLAHV
jgi:hypothetical protein